MRLADLVASETSIAIEHVMLLRNSNSTLKKLVAAGGSVEEYTCNQPTGSPYDYLHPAKPPTKVVVVIVNDAVYGVYRDLQVAEEGTTYSLASAAHMPLTRIAAGPSDPPSDSRWLGCKAPVSA